MNKKILFVDDEENVLLGYRRALRGQFEIETESDPWKALQRVDLYGPYAVVVVDMRMPGLDGMELLSRLKGLSPDTVRMMVTGYADQKTTMEAVNKGEVYRFLNKPCAQEVLVEALHDGLLQYTRIQTEKERLARSTADVDELTRRLHFETHHDLLTGLYNRHAFERELCKCLEAHVREPLIEHSLCHLDLDHFHVVNDNCGQLAGDAVLRAVAELIVRRCRINDVVGRLAGDEFGILLQACPLEKATGIIDEIRRDLENMAFEWEGKLQEIRASAGLVSVTGQAEEVALLLSTAETACHVAKDLGRGRLHIAGPEDELLTERLSQAQWVAEVASALRDDRFQLFAQSIVPLRGGDTGPHYELLIRMPDSEGRLLLPGVFLGAAERFHLSSQIDRWVITAAAKWLAGNPRHLSALSMCSINLSGHSIGDSEMLGLILKIFSEWSIPPSKICFEITETAAIARLNLALQFIRELREWGFRFALDDFGSGLSSFGYLKNLPVDYLKIDGMFVTHIDTDAVDRTMVRCVSEVAKALGIQTIAEYVDSAAILEVLKEVGVDFVQGFHIAKPCPLGAFLESASETG